VEEFEGGEVEMSLPMTATVQNSAADPNTVEIWTTSMSLGSAIDAPPRPSGGPSRSGWVPVDRCRSCSCGLPPQALMKG
jgi:hypothetical protein